MESMVNRDETVKQAIIQELVDLGCCNLCVLRYLGNTDPFIYRKGPDHVAKMLFKDISNGNGAKTEDSGEPAAKIMKKSPCATCLGLLDPLIGTCDSVIDTIVKSVKEADIQSNCYAINITLPISVSFRAYFVWYRLLDKYPKIYDLLPLMKPEGVCLKNAWKWICTGRLKEKIDPTAEWVTEGNLMVDVTWNYDDDVKECIPLKRQIRNAFSRINVDDLFREMGNFEFKRKFGTTLPPTCKTLSLDSVKCSHAHVYIAGRYNKFSRRVSQTPWIVDGKSIHDGSVEELISEHVVPLMLAEKATFSASGREDVDVRMLGQGRPFLMEIVNPKRTYFSQKDMNLLRDQINSNTSLIRVRDVQLIPKVDSSLLKDGEESKTKTYCALCLVPDSIQVHPLLEKLNATKLPIVLQQKTPIRVLHRRSLMTRERSIYSMNAVPCKSPNMFKLYVKTQAGTYVKEFVHGDLGRTSPSVAEILGCDADIVALDVESIDFPWPPTISEEPVPS